MATDNLQIPDIAAGQNQKEITANAAHNLLDRATNNNVAKAISGSTSLTTTESRENFVIELTGTPGAGFNLDMPDTNNRTLTIVNNSDSEATIRNSVAGGAGQPVIGVGEAAFFHYDGTDFFDISDLGTPAAAAAAPVEVLKFFPVEGRVTPTAAGGCAVLATVATSANRPDVTSLNFDQTTAEHAQLRHVFEEAAHLGNVSFQFLWSHAAATTFGATWLVKAVAISDDDTLDVVFEAARNVDDVGGTTDDHYLSARTGFVKSLTPLDLDYSIFDLSRDPVDAGDTLDVDARLQGVIIHYWDNIPLDTDWASVSLMAGFDGNDAETDQNDESDNGFTATYVANAQVDTAQSKFSKASLLTDGTGDAASFPDNVVFELGSGDFTIEAWHRWTADPSSFQFLQGKWLTSGSQKSIAILYDGAGNELELFMSTDGSTSLIEISETFVPTLNQWYHIAADFDGTTYRLYVDGVVLGTSTTLRTLFDGTATWSIGGQGDGSESFNGHHDEVRVTKGVARYTGPFTPLQGPFPRG